MAADINPIGAISKTDLKKFIAYARDAFELPVLSKCVVFSVTPLRFAFLCDAYLTFTCGTRFLDAVPTAELEPITETYVQADEASANILYVFSSQLVDKC